MAYSFKGSISFGLVYIPIKLETSASSNDISFNQLDKKTMSRVRYQKTCDDCGGRILDNKDIVKAYRYDGDNYVVLQDEDFEKIKTRKEKGIVIEQFVSLSEIDPVYFNKSYFVVPTGAEKAYSLLLSAMKSTNKVGIAKTVLGQKETLVAIRENNGQMLLNTLFFADEVKQSSAAKVTDTAPKAELDIAVMIIEGMSQKFDITEFKDEYSEKLMQAIEAKIAGREISVPKEKHGNITNLMEALKQSVQNLSPKNTKSKPNTAAKKSSLTPKADKEKAAKQASAKSAKKSTDKSTITKITDIRKHASGR